ncbi:MAG: chorismate-binding protein, partial [Prolixibacteraceae bacterium]|nr:chorismate-binding protein [Prolixibacteraceae bacterium]
MITDNYFKHLLDQLMAKNYPFAIWTMPGEIMPVILIGGENDVLSFQDVTHLNNKEGFVFAPFRIQEKSPLLMIKPGVLLQNEEDFSLFCADNLPQLPEGNTSQKDQYFISKKEYLKDIKKTVEFLSRSSLSKVIISRLISKNRGKESIGNIYWDLKEKSPKAFVYLVHFPQAGTWMGATPEILFNTDGKTVETVSLAGTQSFRKDGDYGWHTKEIEEQAFVSRYMLDVFYHFNIYPYTTRGPETLESGNVAHLKTNFYFTSDKIKGQWGNFVKQLHPTPAVCGLPKEDAD